MKLSTENGIRSFLINIADKCKGGRCIDCPMFVNSYPVSSILCCRLRQLPAKYNVNEIIARYKEMMRDG